MTERPTRRGRSLPSIVQVSISGYKSIREEQSIEIAPLTILAGANSSGKSSIIQPLLLLKQTLEATYDPGPLLLDGANVRFTEAKQLFFRTGKIFQIALTAANNSKVRLYFERNREKVGLQLTKADFEQNGINYSLTPGMSNEELQRIVGQLGGASTDSANRQRGIEMHVIRNRCFLEIDSVFFLPMRRAEFPKLIQSIIHLPGLRGNPERTYPVSAVGDTFPGTFEKYTASIIAQWQDQNDEKVKTLAEHLLKLGLTWKVEARRYDDTKVELRVGRTPTPQQGGAKDLVSVADVGFGVSQTLPVLVALLAAKRGQLVYLEQPEIHLHPRAQVAMAAILADAAKRGVRVIVETHSSLLLLAVQTLIAENHLSSSDVKLHWFSRNDGGETTIITGEIDETGAFGNWPQDFGEVELRAEQRFLDAAEIKLYGQLNGSH